MENIQEKELMQRVGKENPFLVPARYFDTLPQRVMTRIERKQRHNRVWLWSVAAVLSGCIVWVGAVLYQTEMQTKATMDSAVTLNEWDDLLDYNLVNNYDIEYFLTEAE